MTKDVTMMSQGDFNSLVLERFPIHLLATLGSELLQAFEELPGRENNQFVRMMLWGRERDCLWNIRNLRQGELERYFV